VRTAKRKHLAVANTGCEILDITCTVLIQCVKIDSKMLTKFLYSTSKNSRKYNVQGQWWDTLYGDFWTAGAPDDGEQHRENLLDERKRSSETQDCPHHLAVDWTTSAADHSSIQLGLGRNMKRSGKAWPVMAAFSDWQRLSVHHRQLDVQPTGRQEPAQDRWWKPKQFRSAERGFELRVEWTTSAVTACWTPPLWSVLVLCWPVLF